MFDRVYEFQLELPGYSYKSAHESELKCTWIWTEVDEQVPPSCSIGEMNMQGPT